MCTDLLDDGFEGNLRKEGRSVRIVVTIISDSNKTKVNGIFSALNGIHVM